MYQVLLNTINRDNINWSAQIEEEIVPSNITIQANQMKFAIKHGSLNLNDPNISYIDVVGF